MCAKVNLLKIWYKNKIYKKWQCTSDSNTRVMKGNKAMVQ